MTENTTTQDTAAQDTAAQDAGPEANVAEGGDPGQLGASTKANRMVRDPR